MALIGRSKSLIPAPLHPIGAADESALRAGRRACPGYADVGGSVSRHEEVAPRTLGEKVLGAESHWLMGRVMPREFLEGIAKYLHHAAPEHEEQLIAAIRNRAEQLADADEDLIVDEPSKGALALCAVTLAAFETLLPMFDGDERRTILYLQHEMGTVLKRPYELMFQTLSQRGDALDKIEKACGSMKALYGAGWEFDFDRPEPGSSR
jgi:hypothetical protein